jgi:hypothetical protein
MREALIAASRNPNKMQPRRREEREARREEEEKRGTREEKGDGDLFLPALLLSSLRLLSRSWRLRGRI